jgi:hypothetical protein
MKKMNKFGGDKLLTIWWFIVLGIIGGGIGVGIMVYFSATVNTNGVEAGILGERIMSCIIENGHLKENIFNQDYDIFKECSLDKRLFGRGSYLYFNVSISGNGVNLANFTAGDYSFEKDCSISSSSKISATNFAKCYEKTETVLNGLGEVIKIHVLAGSNQQGGRIIN